MLAAADSEATAPPLARIDAALLIPGRGEPLRDASLVAAGPTIAWVGASGAIPAEYAGLQAVRVPVLMPGLWDCHVHYGGKVSYDAATASNVPPALAGARVARDLAATLDAGFTSVREMAGYGIDIEPAVRDGWLAGPRVYSAGAIIGMTAGHPDLRANPLELNKAASLRGANYCIADGPDECLRAVRLQVRRGARVIKIATTGGVGSATSVDASQFSPAEIAAVVDEAARNDLVVAAHCLGAAGVKAAIRGGVRTVEHGSLADDECRALMLQHGVTLVATRAVQDFGARHPELFSREGFEKIKRVDAAARVSYAKAIAAGVRVALGTDVALSAPIAFRHGASGREFALAVDAGMSPLQAIEAGTANAPATLGPQAPLSGQLRAGFDADFIALSASPLDDIGVLADPARVTHVWKAGALAKAPGVPTSPLLPRAA